jgi:hypothetical protein
LPRRLRILCLEENYFTVNSTKELVMAWQRSNLFSLSLDLQHGGEYTKPHTAEELSKIHTLTMSMRRRRTRTAQPHHLPPSDGRRPTRRRRHLCFSRRPLDFSHRPDTQLVAP